MSNTHKDNFEDEATGQYTPVPSGDPEWVSQLWDRVQGGFSDVSVHDGSMVIDAFRLDSGLASLTGYAENPNNYVCLWSDERGFVSHMIMTEQELYQCEGMPVEDEGFIEYMDNGFDYCDFEFGGEGG